MFVPSAVQLSYFDGIHTMMQEFKRGLAPSFIRKLPFGDNIAGFIGNYFMQQFEKKYSHIHAAATFEKVED